MEGWLLTVQLASARDSVGKLRFFVTFLEKELRPHA
jgi:hypothetical protein